MLVRHESHFSVSLIVEHMYFQNLGYMLLLTYGLKVLLLQKRYVKLFVMAQ